MPFSLNDEMMREIIIDHYKNPRNKEEINDNRYITIHMDSASCIDDIYLQVLIIDNKIEDMKWHGTGCTISLASTSILSTMIKDMSVDDADSLINSFNEFLLGHDESEEKLKELYAFKNVNRQPSRITCANISFRGLKEALKEYQKNEK